MTKRKMPARDELEIYISEGGYICLKQDTEGDESIIALEPSQIDTVVQWLQDCKRDAERGRYSLEDDSGPLRDLWDRYLGESHPNSWLERLRRKNRTTRELESPYAENLPHLVEAVEENAIEIIKKSAQQKHYWDEFEGLDEDEEVSKVDLPEADCLILAEILASRTLSWVVYNYRLLAMTPDKSTQLVGAIMRISASMEATLSLEVYVERLRTLELLASGGDGPYSASFDDRIDFEAFLRGELESEKEWRQEEESVIERPGKGDSIH